jgi:hypothetical protein
MTNAQPARNSAPENPKVNDTWVDDYGDLYTWNGTDWMLFEDFPFMEPDSPFRDALWRVHRAGIPK